MNTSFNNLIGRSSPRDPLQTAVQPPLGQRIKGREGEIEFEREARSLGSRRDRDPNDRASRSNSTSPLPPLYTPATQATETRLFYKLLAGGIGMKTLS